MDFRRNANPGNPQTSKIPLAELSMLIVIRKSCHQGVFAELQVVFTVSIKSTAAFKQLFASCAGRYRVRNTYHTLS